MTLTTQLPAIQPWDNWEDYAAGMYGRTSRPGAIFDSVRLLRPPASSGKRPAR